MNVSIVTSVIGYFILRTVRTVVTVSFVARVFDVRIVLGVSISQDKSIVFLMKNSIKQLMILV
ncbi:hypothetical protein H6768_06435 [Candidatus Peribacteria bacterium]|nr:hypothetical protein [Candidatus Peribacteria bacterium]